MNPRVLPQRGAHRALRTVTQPAELDDSASLVVNHGFALYLLANVLTADPAHAERLVVQAISVQSGRACEFRELAAAVHIAWSAWGSMPTSDGSTAWSGTSTQVMQDLHALPDDQRAAIALCQYGAHTYRQAADLVGLPAADMAKLLGVALLALATPGSRVEPSPPASLAF